MYEEQLTIPSEWKASDVSHPPYVPYKNLNTNL